MSDIVIRVESLSKRYKLGATFRRDSLKDLLTHGLTGLFSGNSKSAIPYSKSDYIWALKDVSFDVKRGETLGIIGQNGAGKSTLLKILSRITEPTTGRAEIHGRVGSLLEVGTGFHPELTGRENVYLNGAILGMSKTEIDRKYDEIVDFSGVEKFIDTPVKRYSSGMRVRLAFAVAAHLDPEIIIVDEVLAVGDVQFQKKCLGKMGNIASEGRTVLFVSHNLPSVESLCQRALVLYEGEVIEDNRPVEAISKYLSLNEDVSLGGHQSLALRDRTTGFKAIFQEVWLTDCEGHKTFTFRSDEPISVNIQLNQSSASEKLRIGIGISDESERRLTTVGTRFSKDGLISVDGGATICCTIEPTRLAQGRYTMTLVAGDSKTGETIDIIDKAIKFEIIPTDYFGNGQTMPPDWGVFLSRSHWELLGWE